MLIDASASSEESAEPAYPRRLTRAFESRIHKRSVVDEGPLVPLDTSACALIVDFCIIEPRHLIFNNVAF